MLHTIMRFDMRAPAFSVARPQLYKAALEMAEYADRNGFSAFSLSEHHGSDDGYLPSPIVLAAGIAARTQKMQIMLAAMIVPLHDPLRLAEDLAVLDQLSNGRVTLVAAGGYVASEYAMFAKDMSKRGALVGDTIQTLRKAWSGEAFEYNGRSVRVTPTPVQKHLPIFMGGSVPAAAKRAARLADGFHTHNAELYQIYFDAAKTLGKNPRPFHPLGPGFVHVAENPDAEWKKIAPHAMHEMNAYGKWAAEGQTDSPYRPVTSIEELKASGGYVVVTPNECIELGKKFGAILLHPLMGGLDPEVSWKSLELYVEKVLPAFK
ncbi:MAG TPA: LLM class flavin-dependent oxidoreductase [Spongiibacteraceae bacterium]